MSTAFAFTPPQAGSSQEWQTVGATIAGERSDPLYKRAGRQAFKVVQYPVMASVAVKEKVHDRLSKSTFKLRNHPILYMMTEAIAWGFAFFVGYIIGLMLVLGVLALFA